MRNFTFLLMLIFISFTGYGQVSFADDFEAYSVGDYIDQSSDDWNTWSNNPGSSVDCKVTDEKAASGSKSLKIFAKDGGASKDLLLKFKGTYESGIFTNSMMLNISGDSRAYFNYQANPTQGTQTALHTTFQEDGVIEFRTVDNEVLLLLPYPKDRWFEFSYEINLDENEWLVRIDGLCAGSFKNTINKISSMNIYAVETNDNFYLDDMAFGHNPDGAQIELDAAITNFDFDAGEIEGIIKPIEVEVINNGSSNIGVLEFKATINGIEYTETASGIDIEPGQSYNHTFEEKFEVEVGDNSLRVEILSVNNKVDDQECNNVEIFEVKDAFRPAPFKAVIVEEGTGTWCPWCVRGTVFMDVLSHRYEGLFIPIAIHNGDPMVVDEYDSFVANWPEFRGYPGMIIARKNAISFGFMDDVTRPFLREITTWPNLTINTGVTYDESTRKMDIVVFVKTLRERTKDLNLNLVITEDGVTGTGPGYNQANAYAGGGNGPMGGYELLPQSVPADQMVYDHVARAVYGLTPSAATSMEAPFGVDDVRVLTFSYTVPSDQNPENMFIIPIVNEGSKFINAKEVSFEDAIARGVSNVDLTKIPAQNVKVYPNPTSGAATIDIAVKGTSDVLIELFDNTGGLMAKTNHKSMSGDVSIPVRTDLLTNGLYNVRITTNYGTISKKLIVTNF